MNVDATSEILTGVSDVPEVLGEIPGVFKEGNRVGGRGGSLPESYMWSKGDCT
jgi:hypothetical protein